MTVQGLAIEPHPRQAVDQSADQPEQILLNIVVHSGEQQGRFQRGLLTRFDMQTQRRCHIGSVDAEVALQMLLGIARRDRATGTV